MKIRCIKLILIWEISSLLFLLLPFLTFSC